MIFPRSFLCFLLGGLFSPIGIVFDFRNKGILPCQRSIVAIKRRLRHQIKACVTRMREWPIFSTKFIISQMKSSKQKIGCLRPSPPGYVLFQLPNENPEMWVFVHEKWLQFNIRTLKHHWIHLQNWFIRECTDNGRPWELAPEDKQYVFQNVVTLQAK